MSAALPALVEARATLPMRDGVGASCIALPSGPWATVLDFLETRFATVPREEIAARMARGDVMFADGRAVAADTPYCAQQKLYYYRSVTDETRIPFAERVLYEDDLIVAADKPHFLPVTPGGRYVQETLLVRLKRKLGLDTLAPMHRIDRETAGIVVFTKQPAHRARYHDLFPAGAVEKRYQAVAPWRDDLSFPFEHRTRIEPDAHFMRMREADGEPNAETRIDLIETGQGIARYRLEPRTGKRHQLRVHMAGLGMPILNDQIYPVHLPAEVIERDDFRQPLQLLAEEIAFRDPVSGEQRRFRSSFALLPLA